MVNILKSLLEILLPRYCKVCGCRLAVTEEHLCVNCLLSMPYYNNYKGGMNIPEELLFSVRTLVRAESMLTYDKESNYRKILYHLKYYGHPEVATYLSRMAAYRLQESNFFDGIDYIIPVPLSKKKKKSRGYNQCSYIAKGISDVTGIEIADNIVLRSVTNTQQAAKGKLQRWENAEGIFQVMHPELIENKHLLIVDDVMTTGSTLNSMLSVIEKSVPTVKQSVFTLALAK